MNFLYEYKIYPQGQILCVLHSVLHRRWDGRGTLRCPATNITMLIHTEMLFFVRQEKFMELYGMVSIFYLQYTSNYLLQGSYNINTNMYAVLFMRSYQALVINSLTNQNTLSLRNKVVITKPQIKPSQFLSGSRRVNNVSVISFPLSSPPGYMASAACYFGHKVCNFKTLGKHSAPEKTNHFSSFEAFGKQQILFAFKLAGILAKTVSKVV